MTDRGLTVSQLVAGYGGETILHGLDLAIAAGRVTAIVGANACGKSTLLRAASRLLRPQGGHVLLDGKDIHATAPRELARRLGLLPQSPIAPEGITVLDLVGRGRNPHMGLLSRWSRADEDAVTAALEATKTMELAERPVDELSGGQRQRVWIAMALAQQTDVLLLDEPTTFLDIRHQVEVLDLLIDLNEKRGTTIVMVLHDLNLASRYCDALIAMADGRLHAMGPPEAVLTEAMVHHVFGIHSRIVADPLSGRPMMLPIGRHRMTPAPRAGPIHPGERRMNGHFAFRLAGAATPADSRRMLDEVCDHFVEHAEVRRVGDTATLTDELGSTVLRLVGDRIEIELASPSQAELNLSRNHLAEHMFYFAGAEPLDLTWRAPPPQGVIANLHEATVVAAYDVTRNMRRVVFRCADIEPFLNGDIHVRLLIPARGREPVWPGYRADGRVDWPEGEYAPVVRAYTIRAVDVARGELSIDFLQHPSSHGPTPGADFARDAKAGERVALLGPGSGGIPRAQSILLAGDESALPAIARIVEELPPGASAKAIIEVEDAGEERYLPRIEGLDVTWLHRSSYAPDEGGRLGQAIGAAIENMPGDTFVFVACEKQDVRSVRTLLKRRGHARGNMYVAWYWERQP